MGTAPYKCNHCGTSVKGKGDYKTKYGWYRGEYRLLTEPEELVASLVYHDKEISNFSLGLGIGSRNGGGLSCLIKEGLIEKTIELGLMDRNQCLTNKAYRQYYGCKHPDCEEE